MLLAVQSFCRAFQKAPREAYNHISKTVNYAVMVSKAFADLERLQGLERDLVDELEVPKRHRSGAYKLRAAKRAAAVEELTLAGLPVAGLSSIMRSAEKLASKNVQLASAGAVGVALGLVMPYAVSKVRASFAAKHKSKLDKGKKPEIPKAPVTDDEVDEVQSSMTAALALDVRKTTPTFSPELTARMASARSKAEFLEFISIQIETLNLQRQNMEVQFLAAKKGGTLVKKGLRFATEMLESVPFIGAAVEATQEALEVAYEYKSAVLKQEIARLRLMRVDLQARVVSQFDREMRVKMNAMALAVDSFE
jgi:hypothetical protein